MYKLRINTENATPLRLKEETNLENILFPVGEFEMQWINEDRHPHPCNNNDFYCRIRGRNTARANYYLKDC